MLYLLGLGHWDFPCSVHAGSWRWTGKFTSHLWKSTWLPLDTSDPTVRAFWFACTDFYCLLLRLWNLPFLCYWVSRVWHSLAWFHIPRTTFSAFQIWSIHSVEQLLLLFLWLLPFSFPLLISIYVSRPIHRRLHLPHALRLGVGSFSSMNNYFLG